VSVQRIAMIEDVQLSFKAPHGGSRPPCVEVPVEGQNMSIVV